MRLGYLVPEFPNQTHAFFWREVVALRSLGHQVTLYSTTRPPDEACLHEFAEQARSETNYLAPPSWSAMWSGARFAGIRRLLNAVKYVLRCRGESLRHVGRVAAVAACATELVHRASQDRLDHLHIHSCGDAAHLGAVSRILGGPRYSLTLHGDMPVYGGDHAEKMRRAAFVATVTRPLHDQVVRDVNLRAEQVPVIWMGVDTDQFVPTDANRRTAGPLRLLTVARLSHTKGHHIALEAVRVLVDQGVDLRYTIAGSGPEQAAIDRRIGDLKLHDVVHMTGSVSENSVVDLLRESDVFVLPSFGMGEAAPVAVMEAMSCGVSVVSTTIGGTPDMIRDGVDGLLVAQQDVAELAEAIAQLATQPGRRAEIAHDARNRAKEAFDYRTNAARLAYHIER